MNDRDTLAATKLTRTEFAVVRAYAQGMRPVDIANRYLRDPDDDDDLTEHQAIQRILTLRDRLVQFALQHDRPDIAGMFEALRGRSDTGMTRRVEALSSIEQLGQGRPLPSHRVSLWFGPNLARRLVGGGIETISDLVALVNHRGNSWWRQVPRIGRQSADVIVRWLVGQQAQLDLALRKHVHASPQWARREALPAQRLGADMRFPVPLELMLPPPDTSPAGAELADDLQRVRAWVGARAASPNTWKSYRREAERLLLWAARQGRSVRHMTVEDLGTYQSFLENPQPIDFWCGPASPRDKVHWRPFEGPLRASSRDAALRVVRALIKAMAPDRAWPVRSGHPVPAPAEAEVLAEAVDRSQPEADQHVVPDERDKFEIAEINQRFLDWLANDTASPRQHAALAAALLIARHGLRVVELPKLSFGHLASGDGWYRLHVDAKSKARRGEIELAADVQAALSQHWRDRGLAGDNPATWPSAAALLAPTEFPATQRGQAKQARASAGYSASGLEQLLRASWKRFAAEHSDVPPSFTPRQLRLA